MIRAYDPSDLGDVLGVWYRASRVAHDFLDDGFFETERRNIETTYLPVAKTFVFVGQGDVVGFLSLMGSEVGAIFVDPACHGQGIGYALMDHARRLRGALELDVFEKNDLARRFYDRFGFNQVGELRHEATGERLLRLRLPESRPSCHPRRGCDAVRLPPR